MTQLEPYQQQLQKAITRHVQNYAHAAFVVNEIGERLLARMAYFRLPPHTICDLGCGQGADSKSLALCYSQAEITAVDFNFTQLQHFSSSSDALVCHADAMTLPLPSQYYDLVFANLLLPAILDYTVFWQEVQRILKPGGIFLFSTLGPSTLSELSTALQANNASNIVNVFPEPPQIGDGLVAAGFQDPAIDSERITLHYSSLHTLLHELKQVGSIKLWDSYPHLYRGKHFWKKVEQYYQANFLSENKKLIATVEASYGIAFAPLHAKKTGHEIPLSQVKRRN